jgi:hypothetical protein
MGERSNSGWADLLFIINTILDANTLSSVRTHFYSFEIAEKIFAKL